MEKQVVRWNIGICQTTRHHISARCNLDILLATCSGKHNASSVGTTWEIIFRHANRSPGFPPLRRDCSWSDERWWGSEHVCLHWTRGKCLMVEPRCKVILPSVFMTPNFLSLVGHRDSGNVHTEFLCPQLRACMSLTHSCRSNLCIPFVYAKSYSV
jgi:hypothetical protein